MLYDVIIIGGGVSGLSAAYTLKHNNQRVLVVERGKQGIKEYQMYIDNKSYQYSMRYKKA